MIDATAIARATDAAARRAERAASQRKARKARKVQQASAAVAAEIWDDREGKSRPTPERRAKGSFVLRDGEDAGVTFAVDEAATVIDQLAAKGLITEDQRQAGHDLAGVIYRTRITAAGRSCLNMDPVGHDSNDAPETHQQARDRQQRLMVWTSCRGPWVWPELMRVCGHNEQARHLPSLRDGLDICTRVFGR